MPMKLWTSNKHSYCHVKKISPNKSDHHFIAAAIGPSMCVGSHVTLSNPHAFTVRSVSAFINKMLEINKVAYSVYLLLRSVNYFIFRRVADGHFSIVTAARSAKHTFVSNSQRMRLGYSVFTYCIIHNVCGFVFLLRAYI